MPPQKHESSTLQLKSNRSFTTTAKFIRKIQKLQRWLLKLLGFHYQRLIFLIHHSCAQWRASHIGT